MSTSLTAPAVLPEPPDEGATGTNLTHHFLIAMPALDDEVFARSVVYICEHSSRGALGLVINQPMQLSVEQLLMKVDLLTGRGDLAAQPVFQGGPVQPDRGFVLHDPIVVEGVGRDESIYASTLAIPGGLEMTTSRDILEAIAHGGGPKRLLMALGYASWEGGQLEREIADNVWLTVPARADLIFHTPPELRWEHALALLGVQPWTLTSQAGHA